MNFEKKFNFFNTLLITRNQVILNEFLKLNKPLQFKDFKLIINPNTEKKYSTKTISKSLKELESEGLIQNEIMMNSKKKVLGYAITKKGIESIDILKETEIKLKKISN